MTRESLATAHAATAIDKARKQAKGGWWTYVSPDSRVKAKGHATWIQRIEVTQADGRVFTGSGTPDITVRKFNNQLLGLLSGL